MLKTIIWFQNVKFEHAFEYYCMSVYFGQKQILWHYDNHTICQEVQGSILICNFFYLLEVRQQAYCQADVGFVGGALEYAAIAYRMIHHLQSILPHLCNQLRCMGDSQLLRLCTVSDRWMKYVYVALVEWYCKGEGGNQSTRRKTCPHALGPRQITHGPACDSNPRYLFVILLGDGKSMQWCR
jgi:hypothetical protein